MTFLISALLVTLLLSLVNAVACWFGSDVADEPETEAADAHHGTLHVDSDHGLVAHGQHPALGGSAAEAGQAHH